MTKPFSFLFATLFATTAFAQTAQFGTYTKPFSADSPWNIRPIGPVFGADEIPADVNQAEIGAGKFATAAFLAKESDPPMVVTLIPSKAGAITDADSRERLTSITIPHWPEATLPASGSDGHAEIVDPFSGRVHSFWQLKKVDGKWRAALHGWSPLAGRGWGDPGHYYQGARAVGVSTLGGLIRIHEVDDGKPMFEHALAMTMSKNGLSPNPAYIYPATSADDTATSNLGRIPEGALMMLPPNYATTTTNPLLLKVIETLKVYGARVVDRNEKTPFTIVVENGSRWPMYTGNYAVDKPVYDESDRIRRALRQVISANSYVDGNGQPTTADRQGNFNILSMRGPWALTGTGTGRELAPYNTLTQSIEFTSKPYFQQQDNGNGTGIAGGKIANGGVTWGRPVAGDKFLFTAIGTGGAQVKLMVYGTNPNGTPANSSTEFLSNGQSKLITWPNGGWASLHVQIGANKAGSIRATMVKQ